MTADHEHAPIYRELVIAHGFDPEHQGPAVDDWLGPTGDAPVWDAPTTLLPLTPGDPDGAETC